MSKAIAVVTLAAALTGAAAVAGAQEAVAAAASFVADGPTATDDVAVPSAPARTPHGILRPALYASFAGLQAYDAYTTIVGIDRNPARLELARELGATHTVDARDQDAVAAVERATGAGADFSLETTGLPQVLRQAVDCSRPSASAA